MSPEDRARTPRTEVSESLPFAPAFFFDGLMAEGNLLQAGLEQGADDGDSATRTVRLMLASARTLSSGADEQMLYEQARESFAAGAEADCLDLLAALAELPRGRKVAMLGLAVLATRRDRLHDAATLIEPCLEGEQRHPRALSIAGICSLADGDARMAQAHLAAASRLARRDTHFRGELQIAQKALLRMHFG